MSEVAKRFGLVSTTCVDQPATDRSGDEPEPDRPAADLGGLGQVVA